MKDKLQLHEQTGDPFKGWIPLYYNPQTGEPQRVWDNQIHERLGLPATTPEGDRVYTQKDLWDAQYGGQIDVDEVVKTGEIPEKGWVYDTRPFADINKRTLEEAHAAGKARSHYIGYVLVAPESRMEFLDSTDRHNQ